MSTVRSGTTALSVPPARQHLPRVACLGVGWIGRSRMQSLARSGVAEVVGVADPDSRAREQAAADLPGARSVQDLTALLELELDGVVIATPSALHAAQAVTALQAGVAVFCQKPLARDATETQRVIQAAQDADRLLRVDLSYRHTTAAGALRAALHSEELGTVHTADLVFHNAYGPDKSWFTQRSLSGGGCLVDLGTHLIDLVLWLTGGRDAAVACARLRHHGHAVDRGTEQVEDFACAELDLDIGVTARLACSWFLPAGRDCVFECTLYGTHGAVSMRNLNGSFYDFTAERYDGTTRRELAGPSGEWGAGAINAWSAQLAVGCRFDFVGATELQQRAALLDRIYEVAR
jgi:predicted dehydrogenase